MNQINERLIKPAEKLAVVYISSACCVPALVPVDEAVQRHLKEACERLGVYVDIYVLHLRQMAVFIKTMGESNPVFREKMISIYKSLGRDSFPVIVIRDHIISFHAQVPPVELLIEKLKPLMGVSGVVNAVEKVLASS